MTKTVEIPRGTRLTCLCVALAVAAAFCSVIFLDPLVVFILTVGLLIWIGIPAVFFSLVLLAIGFRNERFRKIPVAIICGTIGFACFVALAIPANQFVQARAVPAAKRYPERVAPLLEGYRRTHGSYPASLDQIPDMPPAPRLLRRPFGYRPDGAHYFFYFPQPGGLINSWQYDSEDRTWRLDT